MLERYQYCESYFHMNSPINFSHEISPSENNHFYSISCSFKKYMRADLFVK